MIAIGAFWLTPNEPKLQNDITELPTLNDEEISALNRSCEYVSPNELSINNEIKYMPVLHHNINGLRSKIDHLSHMLAELQHKKVSPWFITLNEIRLGDLIGSRVTLDGFYLECLSRTENEKAGGVAIAIRE